MRVGSGPAAGGPAVFTIDELHGLQSTSDAGGLLLPMTATVGRVPDDACIADGPTVLAVDEGYIVDCRIVAIGSDPGIVGRFWSSNRYDLRDGRRRRGVGNRSRREIANLLDRSDSRRTSRAGLSPSLAAEQGYRDAKYRPTAVLSSMTPHVESPYKKGGGGL